MHLKTFLPVSFYNKNFVGGWDWWLGVGKMGGRVLLLFPHEARVSTWGFVLSLTPLLVPNLSSYPFIHAFSPPFSICLLSTCPNFLPPPSLLLSPPPPPLFSPLPPAPCLQAAEEASSSSPCPGSTCGYESCFSRPCCAKTLVFSRRPKQVNLAVIWVGGPLSLPCPVTLLPAPSSRFHLWGLAGAF